MIPFSPRARDITASELVTIVNTISDSTASCFGDSAQVHAQFEEGRRFFFCAVPARYLVPGSKKARNDGLAHVAEADKSEFHSTPPVLDLLEPLRKARLALVFQVLVEIIHEDLEGLLLDLIRLVRAVRLIEDENIAVHRVVEAGPLYVFAGFFHPFVG